MRLLGSLTSPFVRKVRVAALEKGLADRVTLDALSPYDDPAALLAANPLAKVPALVLDDGVSLYDSGVIVEYLDTLAVQPLLVPISGSDRFAVLRRQALCDGVMDAAVNVVMEMRRPESERSAHWIARWTAAIHRGVSALEQEAAALDAGFRLDAITAAVMLGYLDFRLPDVDWRGQAPTLAAWWRTISQRESMSSTAPPRA